MFKKPSLQQMVRFRWLLFWKCSHLNIKSSCTLSLRKFHRNGYNRFSATAYSKTFSTAILKQKGESRPFVQNFYLLLLLGLLSCLILKKKRSARKTVRTCRQLDEMHQTFLILVFQENNTNSTKSFQRRPNCIYGISRNPIIMFYPKRIKNAFPTLPTQGVYFQQNTIK